jgi:hypothetical protein
MNNGSNWNYKETDKAANVMLNGQPVPAYIKYDEYTSWDQIQGFAEYAFKLFDDRLTVTPGVKVQDFTRKINTPIAAQSSRQGIATQQSYKPTLPYATANFLIKPDASVYFQYAKGFIVPSLSASLGNRGQHQCRCAPEPQPTKTTNYQAGFVFARDRLNVDADGYYIQASNSTTMDPTTNLVTISANPATYKGLEGQVSYVLGHGLTAITNRTIMSSTDDVTHLWLTKSPNYTALLGAIWQRALQAELSAQVHRAPVCGRCQHHPHRSLQLRHPVGQLPLAQPDGGDHDQQSVQHHAHRRPLGQRGLDALHLPDPPQLSGLAQAAHLVLPEGRCSHRPFHSSRAGRVCNMRAHRPPPEGC